MSHTPYRSLGAIVVACIALFAPAAAQSASIGVHPVYVGSSDAGFNPLPGLPLIDDPASIDPTDFHTFSLTIQLSGMEPDQDFRSMQVDIVLGAGFSPEGFGIAQSYFQTPLIFDPPGPDPPGDAWSTNTDAGTPNDLQEITVLLDSVIAAAALQPGEPGPLEVGQFHVNFDPAAANQNSTLIVAPNGDPFATLWDDGDVVSLSSANFQGPHCPVIGWGCGPWPPEPASLAMLGLTSVILLRRRRA